MLCSVVIIFLPNFKKMAVYTNINWIKVINWNEANKKVSHNIR